MSALPSIPLPVPRYGCVIVRADYAARNLKALRRITDKESRVMLTAENDRLTFIIASGAYVATVVETAVQIESCFTCAVPAKLLRDILDLADCGWAKRGKARNDGAVKLTLAALPYRGSDERFDEWNRDNSKGGEPLSLTVTDNSGRFKLWAHDTADISGKSRSRAAQRRFSADSALTSALLADLAKLSDPPAARVWDATRGRYVDERVSPMKLEDGAITKYVGESFTLTITA